MQVDFQMPGRLGAEYVAEDNTRKVPVMLHRAIVGSLERFIGILIEHYAGALPLWLRPDAGGRAEHHGPVRRPMPGRSWRALKAAGFRVAADLRNEKITYKIREHSLQKLPYQLIVGDKEQQAEHGGRAYPRRRGSGGNAPRTPCSRASDQEVAARR